MGYSLIRSECGLSADVFDHLNSDIVAKARYYDDNRFNQQPAEAYRNVG
jgi:hypothetical protein